MRELALFAGAGGGILGGKLLGWRTVCAVERDAYAAQILAQRQNDGILEPFPIWSDVQTFDGTRWRGIIDVISGGFPCQDISAAGKGAGIEGERSGMWKEMARIIGEVQPRYAFVENSPMLTTRGLGTVLADLAEMGFNAEWGVLSAADVGANHERERIWILAENTKQSGFFSHTKHDRNGRGKQQQESIKETDGAMADTRCKHGGKRNATRVDTNTQKRTTSTVHNTKECASPSEYNRNEPTLATYAGGRLNPTWVEWLMNWPIKWTELNNEFKCNTQESAKSNFNQWIELSSMQFNGKPTQTPSRLQQAFRCGNNLREMPRKATRFRALEEPHKNKSMPKLQKYIRLQKSKTTNLQSILRSQIGLGKSWWEKEPNIGRVANDMSFSMDRLKAIGNGQVPLCAATAFKLLKARLDK